MCSGDNPLGAFQARHFVDGMGEVEVGGPAEILGLDVDSSETELVSSGLHGSDVTVFLDLSADTLGVDDTDEVEIVTLVPVESEDLSKYKPLQKSLQTN